MNFAKFLKDYRQRNNLNQSQLAARLGISRTYVSEIERGVADNLSWNLGLRILDLDSRHGQIEVTLPRRVRVDARIAAEVVWLNQQGVVTEGSCAGPPPTAMIKPSGAERALRLGYEPQYREDVELFEIRLKSEVAAGEGER
jgi:transcriptional regulator with XRE-family HTH domain